MQEKTLKEKLITKINETDDPVKLKELSEIFELHEPEAVYESTKQSKPLQHYFPQIKSLMQQHGAEAAWVFGSAVNGNMNAISDIDFLIRFAAGTDYETYANNYFNLLNALRNLLNRDVDLVTEDTVTNPYLLESINRHKLQIL